MNRKEAKKEFWDSTFKELFCMGLDYERVIKMPYKGSAVDKWIDKIYDEIEKNEKLKEHSCSNCKHFKQYAKNYPRRICSILNCSDIGGCGDYFEREENHGS